MEDVTSNPSFRQDIPDSLLDRLCEGDLEAFELIYRQFEHPAFTLALRLTGQRETAQEVLQDGMLKAFERIRQFRGDAPFWGWLRQLMVNEALMHLRKHKRQDHGAFDEERHADASALPGPWQYADAQTLERALTQLPDTARAVLWLYHVEGYTHAEIAAQFGRTTSFSKSQLARATQRLRTLLAAPDDAADTLIPVTGTAP